MLQTVQVPSLAIVISKDEQISLQNMANGIQLAAQHWQQGRLALLELQILQRISPHVEIGPISETQIEAHPLAKKGILSALVAMRLSGCPITAIASAANRTKAWLSGERFPSTANDTLMHLIGGAIEYDSGITPHQFQRLLISLRHHTEPPTLPDWSARILATAFHGKSVYTGSEADTSSPLIDALVSKNLYSLRKREQGVSITPLTAAQIRQRMRELTGSSSTN